MKTLSDEHNKMLAKAIDDRTAKQERKTILGEATNEINPITGKPYECKKVGIGHRFPWDDAEYYHLALANTPEEKNLIIRIFKDDLLYRFMDQRGNNGAEMFDKVATYFEIREQLNPIQVFEDFMRVGFLERAIQAGFHETIPSGRYSLNEKSPKPYVVIERSKN